MFCSLVPDQKRPGVPYISWRLLPGDRGIQWRPAAAGLATALFLLHFIAGVAAIAAPVDPATDASPKPVGRWQDASLDDYRKHLVALQGLTQACAKARNVTACDPTVIGPDDRLPITASPNAERRIVRYGWLRILFSQAEEPDKAMEAPGKPKPSPPSGEPAPPAPPTTSKLLENAEVRLAADLAQANTALAASPSHDQERAVMKDVLAGREFRNLQQPTERDNALERFGNWLNRFFSSMDRLRARSAWVGRALIWGFFLAVGIGLAWMLLQMERRWRVRLVPLDDRPAPDAASARDWQLWLKDARQAAARGLWREAIHFVYWATISRLESKRLWPADRARTPREYLALLAPEDPRREALGALTRSFERTWYGGREAREADYRKAESMAQDLISGGSGVMPPAAANQPVPAEGGAA